MPGGRRTKVGGRVAREGGLMFEGRAVTVGSAEGALVRPGIAEGGPMLGTADGGSVLGAVDVSLPFSLPLRTGPTPAAAVFFVVACAWLVASNTCCSLTTGGATFFGSGPTFFNALRVAPVGFSSPNWIRSRGLRNPALMVSWESRVA